MKKLIGLTTALVLSGCAHVRVEYSPLNPAPQKSEQLSPDAIEIFTSALPTRKYVEVGTVKGMHDSIADDADMFTQMRSEAALRGCDALVVTQRTSVSAFAACVAYVSEP